MVLLCSVHSHLHTCKKKTCKALTLTPTTTITVAFLFFFSFLLYFLFYLCSLRRCPTTLTARTESQMRNEQTRASAARRSAANASAKHFLSVCNEGRREEWREGKGGESRVKKRRVERERCSILKFLMAAAQKASHAADFGAALSHSLTHNHTHTHTLGKCVE